EGGGAQQGGKFHDDDPIQFGCAFIAPASLTPDEAEACLALGIWDARSLTQIFDRIYRFAAAPQFERDRRSPLGRDPERGPADQLRADFDIDPRQAGDKAGPAAVVLEDHDSPITAIGPG